MATLGPMLTKNWLGALSLSLLACGGASAEQLRSRAAYEMDCPAENLEMTDLGDDTMGVNGCGQQHVYLQDCRGMGAMRECKWVLNSAAEKGARKDETVSE